MRAGGHWLRLGLPSQTLAYTFGIRNGSPALCVHIPFSHCPEHAIQWHSLPLPFVPHSFGIAGSLMATVLKAFNTALLLLAEGSFTGCIYRVFNDIISILDLDMLQIEKCDFSTGISILLAFILKEFKMFKFT